MAHSYNNLRFFDSESNDLNLIWDSELNIWKGISYLPLVSAGLYETLTLHILEEVAGPYGANEYITPIAEDSGDVSFQFRFKDDYNTSEDVFLYSATGINGDLQVQIDKTQSANLLQSTVSTSISNDLKVISNEYPAHPLIARVALTSEIEGFHIRTLSVTEVVNGTETREIAQIKVYGEVEGEDERLRTLLSNIGMNLDDLDYFIFKESNIQEQSPDFTILNQKRKELLLQASQIKPFIGTYKALLNAIDFFGYDKITLKEYWLNINEQSENFGKLKAVAVPNQDVVGFLADKNRGGELPNSNQKKTSRLSLVYRLNTPTGLQDEWDIPTVQETIDYSPDEVLIKLYGLKNKLQKDYLPLQAKIVDITGEGDYFSQFNLNVWNNQQTIKVQNAGVEFKPVIRPEGRNIFIEDLRKVDYRLTGFDQDFKDLNNEISNTVEFSIRNVKSDEFIGSKVAQLGEIPVSSETDGDLENTKFTFRKINNTVYYNIVSAGDKVLRATGPDADDPFTLVTSAFNPISDDIDKQFQLIYLEGTDTYKIRVYNTPLYIYYDEGYYKVKGGNTDGDAFKFKITSKELLGIRKDINNLNFRTVLSNSINNFYNTYYDQSLNTFNTVDGIPIGAPIDLKIEGMEQDWDAADFSWFDGADTGDHFLTWDNWWHRGVYEIEWILTGPNDYLRSFRGPIEEYINFPMTLPYAGLYSIETSLYDLYNVKSTKIIKDAIEVKNKNVEVYGLTQFAPSKLSWNKYKYEWIESGSGLEWSRENPMPVEDVIATYYLMMDRANYIYDEDQVGIAASTVRRFVDTDPNNKSGFSETAGPYQWASLRKHLWDDGPEVTWEMTRVGSDINSSFQIDLKQVNIEPTLTIEQVNPEGGELTVDSYTITSTIPTQSTEIQLWEAVAAELTGLNPVDHPLLSKFNYNPILKDMEGDGEEDECLYILCVGKEPSRSYDFESVYFNIETGVGISNQINFISYNPSFEDTYIINSLTELHKLNHVTLSYDISNMPGVINQEWKLTNNTLNIEDIYYNNPILTHLFEESGYYTVSLELEDSNGNKNTINKNILKII